MLRVKGMAGSDHGTRLFRFHFDVGDRAMHADYGRNDYHYAGLVYKARQTLAVRRARLGPCLVPENFTKFFRFPVTSNL